MGRAKDLFVEEHEKAIAAYLEEHPEADEEEAFERTLDQAHVNMTERLADAADHYMDMMKERRLG